MDRSRWIAGVLGLALLPIGAQAGIDYQYLAKPANQTVALGQSPTFQLYLRETVSGTDSSWIDADGGLGGVGLSISAKDSSNQAFTIVSLQGNTTDFDTGTLPQYDASTNSVTLVEVLRTLGIKGTAVGNVREVFLGTLTLKANTAGSTEFTVGPIPATLGNTFTINSLRDLDQGNDGSFAGPVFAPTTASSLMVAVPEPGTVTLALGVIGLALSSRKRAPVDRK